MHVYDVYKHPRYGYEAVQRGFSWSAFLFPSVWAVRRGLGWITVILVVTTTLMFDIAQIASYWTQHPIMQLGLLAFLVILFGWRPGFTGYRWHARALQDEDFHFTCTVIADSRRQAIKAANDDTFNTQVKMVASHFPTG